MANTVLFKKTAEVKKKALYFEDLKIGDVFMLNYPEARYHYIKVKEGVDYYDFNVICIEDGEPAWIRGKENVKNFVGVIAFNGMFVEFKYEV